MVFWGRPRFCRGGAEVCQIDVRLVDTVKASNSLHPGVFDVETVEVAHPGRVVLRNRAYDGRGAVPVRFRFAGGGHGESHTPVQPAQGMDDTPTVSAGRAPAPHNNRITHVNIAGSTPRAHAGHRPRPTRARESKLDYFAGQAVRPTGCQVGLSP